MSVSSLPEWKQLLLERKRREEEEREKRENEEEERLASMPAWKRGIIQRRRAKQDTLGDKETEREGALQAVDGKAPSEAMLDMDISMLVLLGSEPSLSPEGTGPWLDGETKLLSQVSMETISPVHQNPFICGWRRGRDMDRAGEMGHEKGNEQDTEIERDREKGIEKDGLKDYDGESRTGRDIEIKIERYRDRSEGRERNRSAGRDPSRERERECLKGKKDEEREERDSDPPRPLPLVSGLRTIRADNIIIIEQERNSNDEKRGKRREVEMEGQGEEQENRGVKMELLAGSVTEIRASEILIIKSSAGTEDRSGGRKGSGREGEGDRDREMKCTRDGGKDCEWEQGREMTCIREKERETFREKDWPRGQAATHKEDRKCDTDDSVFTERGSRVSELLSKFGEHPKPPSRSKSNDSFIRPGRDRGLGENDDPFKDKERRDGTNGVFRGVPKRSFSFSDQVICAKENGYNEWHDEKKMIERKYSDSMAVAGGDVVVGEWSEKGNTQRAHQRWTLLSDRGRGGKHREGCIKGDRETGGQIEGECVLERNMKKDICYGIEVVTTVKSESADKGTDELTETMDREEGFTVASVKNTEGISFARRVPIKQDGRVRPVEREVRRLREESVSALERERTLEREVMGGRQTEPQVRERRESDIRRGDIREGTISADTIQQNCAITLSIDRASPTHAIDSHYRHASAFTECSNLLSTVAHRLGDPNRGAEWHSSSLRAQGYHSTQSALSQHTEGPINKIEKVGETMNARDNESGVRTYRASGEAHIHSDAHSVNSIQDVIPKSPKHAVPIGITPTPLEIHIPRTVFYGVEEMLDRKRPSIQSDERQDRERGDAKGVERRDSWRVGKPLSRIESLREKIRQRELDRLRNMEGAGDEGGIEIRMTEAVENTWTRRGVTDRCEERGSEMRREWEAAIHMKKGGVTDRGQEGPATQTSTLLDVTQEVNMSKASSQLPVPLSLSQAVKRVEETRGTSIAASEVTSTCSHTIEREEDSTEHVEELRDDSGWQRKQDTRGQEGKEQLLEEEYIPHYLSPSHSPSGSLSPSPPLPHSLAAMSRIYNLKTVGSRAAVCISERTVDIPSHTPKVQSHISAQQEPCTLETSDVRLAQRKLWGRDKVSSSDEMSGCLQTVQLQVEQLQLREQEVQRLSHDDNTAQSSTRKTQLEDKESKVEQSPRIPHQQNENHQRTQQKEQQTPSSPRIPQPSQLRSPRPQPKQVQSNQSNQPRSVSINSRSLLSPTPENSLKHPDRGCLPTPSPSSCSPSPSPSVSPSPSPSPTRFCIRSASGGQGKRGTTITINPRRPVGGAAVAAAIPGSSSRMSAQTQTPAQNEADEGGKKRYPTAEEIEVIGGYQNLEKSCLVKNRETPKRVKVCFNEAHLEQVCEYPSETSMLASTPYPHEKGREERVQGEEVQDEEEEERGVFVSRNSRSVGEATGRVLRVDESCHR